MNHPDAQRELDILRRKVPQAPEQLAREVVAFAQSVRGLDLFKAPGVSETLDWAQALLRLHIQALDVDSIAVSLGILLKYQDDLARVGGKHTGALLAAARTHAITTS